MEEIKIAGAALPAMPWEERPAGCKDVVWRCSAIRLFRATCSLLQTVYSTVP